MIPEYKDVIPTQSNLWQKQFVRWLESKNYISPSTRVLDAGCGDETLVKIFIDRGYTAYGIDYPDWNFEEGIKYIYPESYDIIIAKMVVEHLVNYLQFIKDCKRILKPNGILIILTYDGTQLDGFLSDPTHVTLFNLPRLESVRKMFGFKNIETRRFKPVPILWRYSSSAFNISWPGSTDLIAIWRKEVEKVS